MNDPDESVSRPFQKTFRDRILPRHTKNMVHGLLLGALVLIGGCTDDRREERLRAVGANPTLDDFMRVADAKVGASKFGQCAACHSYIEGATDRGGPNLFGVYGKPMGTNSVRFGYTADLRGKGGKWDAATLDRWISNPKKMVPGTSMQFNGISDRLDRADIIAYLRQLGQTPN
ncbi:c-type cytochrome [Novosphingobium humi]